MPQFTTTSVTVVTVLALTQLCPAPWAAIAAGAASGAVAGAVSGWVGIGKRDVSVDAVYRHLNAPQGVNQHDFDRCLNDASILAEPVHVSDSENGKH
jgi:hypothetical protein